MAHYYRQVEPVAKENAMRCAVRPWDQRGYVMSRSLFFVLALLAGCASVHSLENLPLVWAPEREPKASAGAAPADFLKTKLKVAPLTDSREKPKLIGENREGARPQPVTTSDDVSAFVTEHFKALLMGAGLNVVDSGESAIIKGDVQQFFVVETGTYAGEVRLQIVVTDPAGNTLWQGVTSGSSTRFGRSGWARNYYESLSDALTLATSSLLQERSFQAAIAPKH